MSIMYKNPTAELVRVKVDLLGYVNVTEEIELDDNKWGEMKREWLPPKPNALWDKAAMTRTAKYTINTKQWKIYKRDGLDDDFKGFCLNPTHDKALFAVGFFLNPTMFFFEPHRYLFGP